MIKYGFTGTRSGMTDEQKNKLIILLTDKINNNNCLEFHHGDCIGADKDFHDIISNLDNFKQNIKIIIHPPINNKLRAYCNSSNIRIPTTYLQRNKNIINETDILIGCPYSNKEQVRSGTWSTIRYAKKQNKKVIIL